MKYNLYLAAEHKKTVTGNPLYSGSMTPIGRGHPQVLVKYAEKMKNGCVLVENTSPLFYQLANYKVTGQYCGMLALTPHKE